MIREIVNQINVIGIITPSTAISNDKLIAYLNNGVPYVLHTDGVHCFFTDMQRNNNKLYKKQNLYDTVSAAIADGEAVKAFDSFHSFVRHVTTRACWGYCGVHLEEPEYQQITVDDALNDDNAVIAYRDPKGFVRVLTGINVQNSTAIWAFTGACLWDVEQYTEEEPEEAIRRALIEGHRVFHIRSREEFEEWSCKIN